MKNLLVYKLGSKELAGSCLTTAETSQECINVLVESGLNPLEYTFELLSEEELKQSIIAGFKILARGK